MYRGFNGGGLAHPGYFFGFPWGGIVMAALVIGLVVIAAVALRRRNKDQDPEQASVSQRGLLILTERFARGEIDAEAFRSMKAELEAQPATGLEN